MKNGFDGSNRPQITLPHMHSKTGLPAPSRIVLPRLVPRTKLVLHQNELLREPASLVIGVVVALFQSDADGFAAGLLLEESHRRANQVFLSLALVHQAQEFLRDLAFLFVLLAFGDVARDMHRADEPTLLVEAGSRADQEVPAQARLMHFGGMLAAVPAGLARAGRTRAAASFRGQPHSMQPDALLGRHAQPLGHGTVGANDAVLIVEDGHEVRDGVEGLFPFLLGLPDRLLRPACVR